MLGFPMLATIPTQNTFATLYIGTYTSPQGSQGIYESKFNLQTGELQPPKLAVECHNPSFVVADGTLVFAVDEQSEGKISSFRRRADGSLIHLSTQLTQTADPCHLVVSPDQKCVIVAGYSGGSATCLPLDSEGLLGPVSSLILGSGTGPDRARQERPHVHSIRLNSKGDLGYICDLGTDSVMRFRLDSAQGQIRLLDHEPAKTPGGAGPRHSVLSADGRHLYVCCEMGSSLCTFDVAQDGRLSLLGSSSTRPVDATRKGNSTAEILLHPNGRWLYVTNRGDNTIALFDLGGGIPKFESVTEAGVKTPRGAEITGNGGFMIVGGQDSDNVVSFKIDASTGRLTPTGHSIHVSKPVSFAFAG